MKLSDLNSDYQNKSDFKNLHKWELLLDEQSDGFLEFINDILQTDLEKTVSDDDKMIIAKNALELFNKLKVFGNHIIEDKVNFIQLDYYSHLCCYFNHRGLFNYSFDCIIYCFSDQVNYQSSGEYHYDRIHKSTTIESEYIQENFLDVFIRIISCIFYYSYKAGGHKEVASDLYNFYLEKILQVIKGNISESSVMCGCNVLSWSLFNNKDNLSIIKILEETFEQKNIFDEIKKIICMQFAGGAYTESKKSGKEWSEICLQKYSKLLRAHEKLHLLSMIYANEELNSQKINDIFLAIEEYHNYIQNSNISNKLYELNRISNILYGIFINLLDNKRVNDIIQLVGKYYQIDSNNLIEEILIICPNYKDGTLYVKEKKSFLSEKDIKKALVDLIDITNKFFNTQLVLNNIASSFVTKAERLGVPESKYGNEFEKYMVEHYAINKFPENIFEGISVIIPIANYNHPIQNLLIKNRSSSKPINISLQKITKLRKIKRMTIWNFGTHTSDLEENYIENIFRNNNVDVKILKGIDSNKNDFLDSYFDQGTDLFWVTTHGEFDDYSPHAVKININKSEFVLGSELINYKGNVEQKRLCVLNICDSGRVHIDDGFLNMGMTAEITNKYQAVISHLWPINPIAALIYGVLLASLLIKENDYFEAHQNAIKIMLKNSEGIKEELTRLNLSELVQTVERSSIDWNNIIYWGSPTYFV